MVQPRDDQLVEKLIPDFVTRDEGIPLWKQAEMGTFFDPDDLLLTLRFDDHRLIDPGTPANYFVGTRGERVLNSPANAAAGSRGNLTLVPSIWPGLPAVAVLPAITNLMHNPVFGLNVTTDYITMAGGVRTLTYAQALYAGACCQYTASGVGNEGFYSDVTARTAAATEYTFSIWARGNAGGEQFRISFWDDVAGYQFTSFVVTQQWARYEITETYGAGSTARWVRPMQEDGAGMGAGDIVFLDGVQLEVGASVSDTTHGDAGDGYSWAATPHGSQSVCQANSLQLDSQVECLNGNDTLSFSMWVRLPHDPDGPWKTQYPQFMDASDGTNNNRIFVFANAMTGTGDLSLYLYINTVYVVASPVPGWRAGDWALIVATVDFAADEYKLFFNGQQIGATGTNVLVAATGMMHWNIGTNWAEAAQNYLQYAEYVAYNRVLTAVEIANIYSVRRPIIDGGAIDKRLPSGIIVYQNANQAIPNNVWSKVAFNTVYYNEHGIFDDANNRIYISSPGWYQVTANARFASSAIGYRGLYLFATGARIFAESTVPPCVGVVTMMNLSSTWYCLPGDYIELFALQNSGAPLNMDWAGWYSPFLNVVKIRNVFDQVY